MLSVTAAAVPTKFSAMLLILAARPTLPVWPWPYVTGYCSSGVLLPNLPEPMPMPYSSPLGSWCWRPQPAVVSCSYCSSEEACPFPPLPVWLPGLSVFGDDALVFSSHLPPLRMGHMSVLGDRSIFTKIGHWRVPPEG